MESDVDSMRETADCNWEAGRGRGRGMGRVCSGRRNERRRKRGGNIQKTVYKILGTV